MKISKVLISVSILAVIIVVSSLYANKKLTAASDNMDSRINKVEEKIKRDDWDSAKTEFAEAEGIWSKTEKTWTILIDHAEIDNINVSFSRIAVLMESQDSHLVLAEMSSLRQYVKHIPRKESLEIKNIF